MMSQETLALVAAIGGIVSAVGGAFAALAAFRSASSASDALNQAVRLERRALVRQLVVSAHGVISEEARIAALVDELKLQYSTLFTFAGQGDGSRQKFYVDRAEKKKQEANTLQLEAKKLIEEAKSLAGASEEDLTQALSKFDGHLVRVKSIREDLQREIDSVAQQNLMYRDKALSQMRGAQ
jgi:hypothetical protein